MKRKRTSESFPNKSRSEYTSKPRSDYKTPRENFSAPTGLYIYGVHPVMHLLKDTNMPIQHLFIQEGLEGPEVETIKTILKNKGILPQNKSKAFLDLLGRNHQGLVAQIKEQSFYKPIDTLKNGRFVFILDHLEDPQNLGSILRTADQFGIDGVIIPKNRSVGVTSTVIKTSSGAALFVPIIQESSLLFVIEKLKEFGYWIYSTSVHSGEPIDQVKFADKVAFIVGNESEGVSEQLHKKADFLVNIPSSRKKKVDSLNVGVATGIIAYQVARSLYKKQS